MCEVAPNTQSLTSLDEFPPSTGLSCTRITFNPDLAAVIAQHTPDKPPPTITSPALNFIVCNDRCDVASSLIIIFYFL
jgi:hypothetical protein